MPSIRRSVPAVAALAALLAVTATACGPDNDNAGAQSTASPSQPVSDDAKGPAGIKDLEKWAKGGWKNWDKNKWLREAADFVNPVIKDLWKTDRMQQAKENQQTVSQSFGQDQGATDPAPRPVPAKEVLHPYHRNAAPVGKVFFDSPEGPMVCSGTVVDDPAHPGKSNLVWTAGHCVHKGAQGGWYRNIVFVPSYNDEGLPASRIRSAPRQEVAPYGDWWADWAQTSSQWITTGAESGGSGSPYDFAVLHVQPESGHKSLQETVGIALPVWFDAPSAPQIGTMGAWGYPAAPPFDGQKMFDCVGKPGRLTIFSGQPTEYRLGCTMTGGSSGGGWFAVQPNGRTALVSNTSIGPSDHTWLAGPHLGPEANGVYNAISRKFAGR